MRIDRGFERRGGLVGIGVMSEVGRRWLGVRDRFDRFERFEVDLIWLIPEKTFEFQDSFDSLSIAPVCHASTRKEAVYALESISDIRASVLVAHITT